MQKAYVVLHKSKPTGEPVASTSATTYGLVSVIVLTVGFAVIGLPVMAAAGVFAGEPSPPPPPSPSPAPPSPDSAASYHSQIFGMPLCFAPAHSSCVVCSVHEVLVIGV